MAFACAFTMFAGAAFTDEADISDVNADAVELLTTLNIIQGDPDGSFAPEREVTRAEMAKMIYTIRNNGNDDASAYETVTTSFTDISGHWAEGYIKYLQNTGIVAGKSAYIFDPDSTVTTGEAMKMALVLGGYRSDKAELTGTNWLKNTVTLATTNGLTSDVTSAIAGGCTRQDAAQILSNALGMTAVQWSEFVDGFVNDSEDGLAIGGEPISIGRKWMDLYTNVGTLISIDGTDLDIQMSASDEKDSDTADDHFINVGTDYSSLLGQKVKVLFSGGKNNSVIGVFAIDDNNLVVVNQNVIGVDAGKLVIDGTSYAIEGDGVTVVQDGQELATKWKAGEFKNEQSANVVSLIDTDGNNKIDAAYIKTVDVQKVSYVASSQIIAGSKTYKFADDSIDENVAKDDWVMITKNLYNDNNDIVVVEKATGAVQATKTKGTAPNTWKQYQIDDTWYNETNSTAKDINTNVKPGVDAEYVAVNGILYYAVKTSAGADKLTDVLFVAYRGQDGLSNDQARVMFPNGDKATINLKNTYAVNQNGDRSGNINPGTFYEYSKSGSTYELIDLSYDADFYGDFTARHGGALNATTGEASYTDAKGVPGTKAIADSADVIVWTTGSAGVDFKHITGKQLKALIDPVTGTITLGDAAGQIKANSLGVFTSSVDGLNRASVLAVEYNGDGSLGTAFDNISSNANYGFITKDAVKLANGNIKFTVWTGSENIEVVAEKSRETDFTKGTIVGYTDIEDSNAVTARADVTEGSGTTYVMTDANAITAGDGVAAGSITAVNGAATKIETNIAGAAEDLDEYSTVLYVDSKAGTGIVDGKATKANSLKVNGTDYYATNLLVYKTEVAVIDVNEIAGSTYGAYALPASLGSSDLTDVQWLNTRTNDTDEGKAYYGAVMQLSFHAKNAGEITLQNVADIEQNKDSGEVTLKYAAGYNKFDSLIVLGAVTVKSVSSPAPVGSTLKDVTSAATIANAFSSGYDTVTLTGTILTNAATVPSDKTLVIDGYTTGMTISGTGTVVLGKNATIDGAVNAASATLDLTAADAATAVNGSGAVSAGTVKVGTINDADLSDLTGAGLDGITATTKVIANSVTDKDSDGITINEDLDANTVTTAAGKKIEIDASTTALTVNIGTATGNVDVKGSNKAVVTIGKVNGDLNINNTATGTTVTVNGTTTVVRAVRALSNVITGKLTIDSGFKGTVTIANGAVAGKVTMPATTGKLKIEADAAINDADVSNGTVEIAGSVEGTLTATGGTTTITGTVNGTVTATAGTVTISGTVAADATVSGAGVTITSDATVEDGATVDGSVAQKNIAVKAATIQDEDMLLSGISIAPKSTAPVAAGGDVVYTVTIPQSFFNNVKDKAVIALAADQKSFTVKSFGSVSTSDVGVALGSDSKSIEVAGVVSKEVTVEVTLTAAAKATEIAPVFTVAKKTYDVPAVSTGASLDSDKVVAAAKTTGKVAVGDSVEYTVTVKAGATASPSSYTLTAGADLELVSAVAAKSNPEDATSNVTVDNESGKITVTAAPTGSDTVVITYTFTVTGASASGSTAITAPQWA